VSFSHDTADTDHRESHTALHNIKTWWHIQQITHLQRKKWVSSGLAKLSRISRVWRVVS